MSPPLDLLAETIIARAVHDFRSGSDRAGVNADSRADGIDRRGGAMDDPFASYRIDYSRISEDRSEERCTARIRRGNLKARKVQGKTEAEIQAAIDQKAMKRAEKNKARAEDIEKRIFASLHLSHREKMKIATQRERDFYYRHNEGCDDQFKRRLAEAAPHELIWRYTQSSEDRIHDRGYTWPGGMVAGKYFQRSFQSNKLPSEEHWLWRRFLTASPCASSGLFMAGPTKSGCRPIWRKIIGYDEPYVSFGERCKDMWRIDLDREFRSARDLRRWLNKLCKCGRLPFLPHVACWFFDDRHPGVVFNPHLFFLLPEGHAVWGDPVHHRLLKQVIATLNRALGGDPGGLANPFHGKNPLSLHCERMIINDTSFPKLGDYVAGMKKANIAIDEDPELTTRQMVVAELRKADFNKAQSNTYFTKVAEIANSAAHSLYGNGFRIGDVDEFLCATIEVASEVLAEDSFDMNWKQKQAIKKLVGSCARWAVLHFDPTKRDHHHYVGAAAHLMKDTDDKKTRQGKGGAYAATRVAERNQAKVSLAIRSALEARREPPFQEIADETGLSLNCVKKHWLSAYIQAAAMLSIQSMVKGVHTILIPKPGPETLKRAETIEQIPLSWRSETTDLALTDHFRVRELRRIHLRRLRPQRFPPRNPWIPPGRNVVDFMASGSVRRFTSGRSVFAKC
jgi:hypothetical protein